MQLMILDNDNEIIGVDAFLDKMNTHSNFIDSACEVLGLLHGMQKKLEYRLNDEDWV